jgi:hypothetical protein
MLGNAVGLRRLILGRRLTTTVLIGLAVVGILLVAAQSAFAVAETDWLGRINEIRGDSGLASVSENPTWTAGILAHLNYLDQTPAEYETGAYASLHAENPASPYYTSEGAAEGGRSDLATCCSVSPVGAIDFWLTAPFHAIGILRPNLEQVAFGRDPATGAAGLDIIGGLGFGGAGQEVLFPGNGSTIDLGSYNRGELPSPIQTCEAEHPGADYSTPGLPLIAMLIGEPEPGTAATLQLPDGATVNTTGSDLCLVTAEDYVTTDTVYGPTGREILEADHAVLVIPREPLVAGSYTVSVSQPAQADLTWSFTADPPPETKPPTTKPPTTTGGGHPQTVFTTMEGGPESNTGEGGGRALKRATSPGLSVHFGTPRFRQGYVPLRLGVGRDGTTTVFSVQSTAVRARSFRVPAGDHLAVHAAIRRYGSTRVTIEADGRTVGRHRFFESR